jgi:hypothetical protein
MAPTAGAAQLTSGRSLLLLAEAELGECPPPDAKRRMMREIVRSCTKSILLDKKGHVMMSYGSVRALASGRSPGDKAANPGGSRRRI